VSQALCQEDRLQLIAEKRKWQTEIENKKRQLEDDRRALQHLKSKALRERWLLDGQEQDEVKRQLEQDEAKTRSLEDTINRLEQELVSLETGSTVATVTSLPTVEVQEEAMPESPPSKPARVAGEITGLEAKPGGEPSVAKASAENPVTMVFMGYQSVEDEAETKKVLGLQGTVTAELVLIDDANGKTSPEGGGKEEATSNGETAGEVAGEVERGAVEVKKEKQLCKCCSIM
uniref:Paralemmin-1 n=1 Tax=Seriola lalandi dorsalis TaxID=1841481 RepID=A0A3B4Y999_SERLL